MISAMKYYLGALAPLALLAMCAKTGAIAPAASSDPSGVEFFEKRIRPVLIDHCYKCHSAKSEKLKANLLLDSRQGAIQGGDTGPAVVPGNPEKSLLIEAIKYANDDMKMPPKTKLPANVVADMVKWVQMGAPWPSETNVASPKPGGAGGYAANYERLRHEHWAWQPLHDSAAPKTTNTSWPANDIDHYILAALEARGMKPAVDADKATLLRRLTYDLTGLPPSPEDIGSFLADASPDAYASRVDQLLASRAFGERWGRHWLDVVRYAESTGSTRNVPYTFAWRYRDYVIDAFNTDKPYNRFISEQVAGDLMPSHSPQEHAKQTVATGFLAMGTKDLNEKDRVKYKMDNVDEQIDVTTRSIMALTVACARCHDHKFDPIPQVDYYAMAGIFKSTQIMAGVDQTKKKGAVKKNYDAPQLLLHLDGDAAPVTPAAKVQPADPGQINALSARAAALRAELQQLRGGKKTDAAAARKEKRSELLLIEAQLQSLRDGTAPAPVDAAGAAMGARDEAVVSDTAVCIHGEPHDLGVVVPRGFVGVVPVPNVSSISPGQSGRLELAAWLTSPENPLTPRVMANRVWAHLFGEGIVRTVDNFGSTGESPANPALLDHLAQSFVNDGWSVKHLVRQMVMSHAYQLSSATSPANFAIDPANRMVWRMSSRRLDAEEIRDGMLAVGGKLDRSPLRGSPAAGLPVVEIRGGKFAEYLGDTDHRSVYLPILRDLVPPVLDLFDFAEPTMVIGSRDTTTVATQALFMMNDPFVTEQARRMAERVSTATGIDDAARVDLAYRLALSRPATAAEKTRTLRYVAEFQHDAFFTLKDGTKGTKGLAWTSFCQALLGSAEFRYLN